MRRDSSCQPVVRIAVVFTASLLVSSCFTSSDDGPGKREPKPAPTTITLANAGSAPIVIGDQCGGSFLSLEHDGQALPYDRSCGCECGSGSACGCPASCRITEELLVPGEERAIEWDGLWMSYGDDPSCYELAGLSKDDEVTAQACFHVGTLQGEPACERESFAYDTERDVVIDVMPHSAARTEQTLVLENQTGGPVEIVTDHCGAQQWVDLKLPGGHASLASGCPCPCNADWTRGDCPACGGCNEDVLQTVENDASSPFTWDGMFFHTYESGCSERYAMPAGYLVQAEVCFLKAGASAKTCQPVSFEHGQGTEARFVVN